MNEPIVVDVSQRVLERFKQEAKRVFPREKYGILIGQEEGRRVTIEDIYYPSDVDAYSNTNSIQVQDRWFVEAEESAQETDARVVGDIHSHPYRRRETKDADRSLSECDWDHFPPKLLLSGICRVTESVNGRLRASIRFWANTIKVETRIGK